MVKAHFPKTSHLKKGKNLTAEARGKPPLPANFFLFLGGKF